MECFRPRVQVLQDILQVNDAAGIAPAAVNCQREITKLKKFFLNPKIKIK